MSEKIKLGIIGLGAMGEELLDVATAHPDYVVPIAADIDQAKVDRLRGPFPDQKFTTVPQEVIDSNVDAIYIATPPKFHADLAIRAMKRRKHIFCEKPLAVDIAEGEAMLAAARGQTGLVTAVNFALADRHAFLEVERAFKAGEIGEVHGVEIRLLFPKWPRDFQADAVWLDGREQGGFIREVFSHFAYITDRLLGPLTAKRIDIEYSASGSEVEADALIDAGGVPVRFFAHSGFAAPETYEWYLFGSRRSYCLRNWGELLVSEGGEWASVELHGERGTEHTRLTSFANAIRGNKRTNLSDFESAFRVQKIVESFHTSPSAHNAGASSG